MYGNELTGPTIDDAVWTRGSVESAISRADIRARASRSHILTRTDVDRADGNPDLDGSYMDQASVGVDAALGESWITSLTTFAGYGKNIGVEARMVVTS